MKNWDATYVGWNWTNMKVPDFTIFKGKGVKGSLWYWDIPESMSHEIYPFSSIFVEGSIVAFCTNSAPNILKNKVVIGPEFPNNPGKVVCTVSSEECLFYCISKESKTPFISYSVDLNKGDAYTLNKGHLLFIAKGSLNSESVTYACESYTIVDTDLELVANDKVLGICIKL